MDRLRRNSSVRASTCTPLLHSIAAWRAPCGRLRKFHAMQAPPFMLARVAVVVSGTQNTPGPELPPGGAHSAATTSVRVLAGSLLAMLVAAAALSGAEGPALIEAVQGAVAEDSGLLGPAVFVVAYVVATVLLFPASVLTLGAGAMFGPVEGTVLVSAASTLGAALAFLTSRYLARPLVEEKLEQYPDVQAIIRGISSQGAKLVLLLRLSPLFPFNVLNYALGLTSIGFWEYVGASWVGMLPGTVAYVFLGGVGRVVADSASSGSPHLVQLLLYGLGAAATIAVTKLAADAASKALEETGHGS